MLITRNIPAHKMIISVWHIFGIGDFHLEPVEEVLDAPAEESTVA